MAGRGDLNKLFIAVGVVVVAILFAALIGPYFVDWTRYRASFERQASAAIGRPVTIVGKASLRLLPTPIVSFTDVRIGDAAAPDVEMERFRAEIELAPLLKGDVRILQMTIERPRFQVDLAALADPARLGGRWRIDPERISLGRLEVFGGSAIVIDTRAGRSWRATGISAVVEAGSLRGPGRVDADLSLDGAPVSLRASIGRIGADGALPAKLTLRSPLYPAVLTADGAIRAVAGATLSYAGAATLTGDEPEDDEEPRSPWSDLRATSAFELTPAALNLTEAQISYGAAERPVIVQGEGRLDLGAQMRFAANVRARQIDIDRALGGVAEQPVAIGVALAEIAAALPGLPKPPIPGELHLDAAGVVVGGDVIQAVGIDLLTDGRDWQVENFAAMLPGETHVDFGGTIELAGGTSNGPGFQGHGRVESRRPAALASWWRGAAGSAAAIGSFSAEADVDIGPSVQKLTNIVATVGGGDISGEIDLHRFEQSREEFAAVTLSSKRADLIQLGALAELLAGSRDLAGRFDQLTLSLRADLLTAGKLEAHSVLLDGGLEDGRFQLSHLKVDDLAGAAIDARGSVQDPFGAPKGRLDASVSARDISGAVAFLSALLPKSPAMAFLKSVAPALSPVQAEITTEAGGAEAPLFLDLNGSFADTHVAVTARGDGPLSDPAAFKGRLTLHVDADDTSRLLTQFGMHPLPVQAGGVSLDATAEGALASARIEARGTLAGVQASYAGGAARRNGKLTFGGDLKAESIDIDPALLLAGLALPGLGEGHAANLAGKLEGDFSALRLTLDSATFDGQPLKGSLEAALGDSVSVKGSLDLQSVSLPALAGMPLGVAPGLSGETWSDAAFAAGIPSGLSVDVALNAATLDLGAAEPARDARLNVAMSDGAFNIDLLDSGFAGGRLKGAVAATLAGGEADARITAAMQAGQLQSLVWERDGLPLASGAMDLSVEASGKGRSVAGVVSTLTGSGSFAIRNGRINALNPAALASVMAAAEGDQEPTEDAARETFATEFGSGALTIGEAAGSFSMAQGVAKLATVSLTSGAASILADATFDLNALTVSSAWSVRQNAGNAPAAQPYVDLTFSGPIANPERSADLRPLLDLMRGRYLQRQLDAIDKLEKERQQAEAAQQSAPALEPAAPAAAPTDAAAPEIAPALPPPSSALTAEDLQPPPAPAADAALPAEPSAAAESFPAISSSGLRHEPADAPAADAPPAEQAPPPADQAAPASGPADLLRQLAPSLTDVMRGAAESARSASDATRQAVEAPERPQARPSPPRASPRAVVPPPPDPTPQPAESYKTLPNGVTIKVR